MVDSVFFDLDGTLWDCTANSARAWQAVFAELPERLTPPDQAPADPSLAPGAAPADCRHFEYEGWDWADLARKICAL